VSLILSGRRGERANPDFATPARPVFVAAGFGGTPFASQRRRKTAYYAFSFAPGDMASNPQKTLYLIGTCVLLLGLIGAATLFAMAGDGPENSTGYEVVNGVVYRITPGDSKRYRHDLERYGGKMAIVTDELGNWFSGLWHGRSLAYTIGVVSLALSGVIFVVGSQFDSGRDRDETE
jgi:hypothetical protein